AERVPRRVQAGVLQVAAVGRGGPPLELGDEGGPEVTDELGVLVLVERDEPSQVGFPVLAAFERRAAEGYDDRARGPVLPDLDPQMRGVYPSRQIAGREVRPALPALALQHRIGIRVCAGSTTQGLIGSRRAFFCRPPRSATRTPSPS